MRLYQIKYNIPTDGGATLIPTVEWFSFKRDASARRNALRKEIGKRMAFEVNRYNAPTSRAEMPKFLTNPELYLDSETPLTLG